MSDIQISTATQKDIVCIQKLAHRIWWAHYPSVISEEQINYMLGENYSEKALQEQMEQGSVFHIIYNGKKKIGFVAIAASRQAENSYFIHKFYVDTAYHSKGIGTQSFLKVQEHYPDAHYIRLAVNRQNYKSINFYFKNGFKIENCLDTAIGHGFVMDDFIMVWKRG